jgi:hypothetical protein
MSITEGDARVGAVAARIGRVKREVEAAKALLASGLTEREEAAAAAARALAACLEEERARGEVGADEGTAPAPVAPV